MTWLDTILLSKVITEEGIFKTKKNLDEQYFLILLKVLGAGNLSHLVY